MPFTIEKRRFQNLLLTLVVCGLAAAGTYGQGGAPGLSSVTRVFETASGNEQTLDAMLDAVKDQDVVFVGESHLDDVTHRVELAIYEGLIARREGRVVLAMEMFERDVQPVLDAYLAGKIPESEFLQKARPWSNYRTGYRPLIETARKRGLPVIASNLPTMLRRLPSMRGPDAFNQLPESRRHWAPKEIFDNGDAYWDRFARTLRGGHMAAMVLDKKRRRTMTQTLWDNTMGESCALALDAHPGSLVLHVNGGFHSQYREGTAYQLLKRKPEAKVSVIDVEVVSEPHRMGAPRDRTRADHVIYAEGLARGIFEEFRAVRFPGELRYRLHLPRTATDDARAPLLVWLHDDGQRAAGGLDRWRSALGDDVAVLAVEAPFPLVSDDLAIGGRWFWPETFRDDLPQTQWSLNQLRDYLVRHFPIDEKRVVLAGEGTGATVAVAAVALGSGRIDVPTIASRPRRFARLREIPVPEPAEVAPGGSLHVLAASGDVAWWESDAAAFSDVGIPSRVKESPEGAWASQIALESAIRGALGVDARERPAPGGERAGTVLVYRSSNARAAAWALQLGIALESGGARAEVVASDALEAFVKEAKGPWSVRPLAFTWERLELPSLPDGWKKLPAYSAESLSDGRPLPIAPGSFGGVTILILPEGTPSTARKALEGLAEAQVLRHRNRFAGLRVLTEQEGRLPIGSALERLGGMGRSSVLLVPVAFCVDARTMRGWQADVAPFADRFDIAWLPGLGGGLARLGR